MRIVLIGFMGSGKSSIAKLLHTALHWPVKDTDELIEQKVGKKIPQIFSDEGEEKFRDYETQILKEIKQEEPLILATGGGIIEKERNHELLKYHAKIIYLQTTPEQVLQFTAQDSNRPLLQKADPLGFVTQKLAFREPIYQKLADFRVPASQQPLHDSAREIINYLKLNPSK